MDDQLNLAPCGYLVIDHYGNILEMNATLQTMLGKSQEDLIRNHIHSLLTTPSRVYYQTYFLPLIDINGQVNEIYLTLRSATQKIPVLMNAVERYVEGKKQIECVLMEMKIRDEYENELIQDKRNTERILQRTDEANLKLQLLLKEVECKKSELEQLNEQLLKLASTDALTGLYNRRYFEEKMELLFDENIYTEKPFSLMLLDIDHFKQINDNLGHLIGDLVLQEIAFKLRNALRNGDVLARMGGEEFSILLPNTNETTGYRLAEEIRCMLEQSHWSHTPVTVSIGITVVKTEDTYTTLYKRTDEALYASKNLGRNRTSIG